jgi:hypothetical protein
MSTKANMLAVKYFKGAALPNNNGLTAVLAAFSFYRPLGFFLGFIDEKLKSIQLFQLWTFSSGRVGTLKVLCSEMQTVGRIFYQSTCPGFAINRGCFSDQSLKDHWPLNCKKTLYVET